MECEKSIWRHCETSFNNLFKDVHGASTDTYHAAFSINLYKPSSSQPAFSMPYSQVNLAECK